MHAPAWHQAAAGGIFVLCYGLIASDRIDKTKVALAGAVALLMLGVVTQHDAFGGSDRNLSAVEHAIGESAEHSGTVQMLRGLGLRDVPGIDWNTIFLLMAMMVYVNILGRTGALEWLALRTARIARGKPIAVLVLLCLVTAGASAMLDNVTTVLLLAPVAIHLARVLAVDARPMLIAIALASNIGGTATLVGDPPNILIGSRSGLDFVSFLTHLGPVVAVLLAVFVPYAFVVWREELGPGAGQGLAEILSEEATAVRDRPLLARCAVVGALMLLGFGFHHALGWEPATVALAGMVAILVLGRVALRETLVEVEWNTLIFFMGLFVMVGALVKTGLVESASAWIVGEFGASPLLLALALLWFSALASALVDNIPYVATMCPLVASLSTTITGLPVTEAARDPRVLPLWWALALGACLGGNATLIGASANVVAAEMGRKAGAALSFRAFTRAGLPVTVWTLAIATAYLVVRYF